MTRDPRDGEQVLLREAAVPTAVRRARGAIRAFASRHGLAPSVQDSAALAVSEACTNVVMHAYIDADGPGVLELRAHVCERALIVQVSDQGRGMRPRPDSPGLGIGLPVIARVADRLEVLDHADRPGVAVRFCFELDSS
jgi:serine/threonine-protein kinase RsbW